MLEVEKEADALLRNTRVPSSVVVNDDLDIIRFRGSIAPYTEQTPAKAHVNLLKVAPAELSEELHNTIHEARKLGQSVRKNDFSFHYNGHTKNVAVEVIPLKISGETFFMVLFEDHSDPESFENFADSAPVMIWSSGTDRRQVFLNKKGLDFTGHGSKEKGQDHTREIHKDDLDRYLHIYNTSFTERKSFQIEYRLRRKDGQYHWILETGAPRFTSDRVFAGYAGFGMDIQVRKEDTQDKDDFIRMASHELKTPITSLKGYVQILEKISPKKMGTKSILQKMNNVVNRLTRLTADLLDLSKIDAGRLELNKEAFAIDPLIRDTIVAAQKTTRTHRLVASGRTNKKIFADKDRIGQVLTNLISNAIKYSPGSKWVNISSQANENEVIISVGDAGIGISKQDQGNVFDRFYRAESSDEQTYPGFGIGLFIAAAIIKQHLGRIWVKSIKGKGSTFYFALPEKTLADE